MGDYLETLCLRSDVKSVDPFLESEEKLRLENEQKYLNVLCLPYTHPNEFFYLPRFWFSVNEKALDMDIFIPNQPELPTIKTKIINYDICPQCFYEICPHKDKQKNQNLYHVGVHNFYFPVTLAGTCDALLAGNPVPRFLLKRDRNNYYDSNKYELGLNPYVLNEVASLIYLQSFKEYRQAWYANFTELQHIFLCNSYSEVTSAESDLCRVYPQYDSSLKKWRDTFGTQPLPPLDILFIVNDLLLALTILEDKKIIHRGITPGNIFFASDSKSALLGGWSHASLLLDAKNEWVYQVDNLLYTAILKSFTTIHLIDRIMLANTIYYLLFQQNPPHMQEWFRLLTEAEIDEYLNVFTSEEKGWLPKELMSLYRGEASYTFLNFLRRVYFGGGPEPNVHAKQMLLYLIRDKVQSLRKKKTSEVFGPKWQVKTETERILLTLIDNLVSPDQSGSFLRLTEIKNKFDVDMKETSAYRRYQNELKREEIFVPKSVKGVIQKGVEVTSIYRRQFFPRLEEVRRQEQQREECKSIQTFLQGGVGMLPSEESKNVTGSATSVFLTILKTLKERINRIPDLFLCTATSLFLRVDKSNVPFTEKLDIPISGDLFKDSKDLKGVMIRVEVIQFFYLGCVFLCAKLYGLLYRPSQVSIWIEGFVAYLIQKYQNKFLIDHPSETASFEPLKQRIQRLVTQFETPICRALKFVFFTESFRNIFEGEVFCPITKIADPQLYYKMAQTLANCNLDYLVLDAKLLLGSAYDPFSAYSLEEIQEFATSFLSHGKNVIFTLLTLSKRNIPIYFMDESDAIFSFGQTLLKDPENSSFLTAPLEFREPEQVTTTTTQPSWYSFSFFRTQPSIPSEEVKIVRKPIVSPTALSGLYFYRVFFNCLVELLTSNQEVKQKLKEFFAPEKSLVDPNEWLSRQVNKVFNVENVVSFNLTPYITLAKLKDVPAPETEADTLSWFSLIHGLGMKEFFIEPLDCAEQTLRFNTGGNTLISEWESGPEFTGARVKTPPSGETWYEFEKTTEMYEDDSKSFKPDFASQLQGLSYSREPSIWLIRLAMEPSILKEILKDSSSSRKFEFTLVRPERFLLTFLTSQDIYIAFIEAKKWHIHLALIINQVKKLLVKGNTAPKGMAFLSSNFDEQILKTYPIPGLQVESFLAPLDDQGLQAYRLKQLADPEGQKNATQEYEFRCKSLLG